MLKKSLLLLFALLLGVFLLVSCDNPEPPEEPSEEDAPPTEEEKQDAIDKIIGVFSASGENVIGNMFTEAPDVTTALGSYKAELFLENKSIYLKDGCIVVEDAAALTLYNAYMLSGISFAWADGVTSEPSDWNFIGTSKLFEPTDNSVLTSLLNYISELDFNDITKSEITYESGLYLISDSFVKSNLLKNVGDDADRFASLLELLSVKLGFRVKNSKIIGFKFILDSKDGFFEAIGDSLTDKANFSIDYSLNSVASNPESVSLQGQLIMKDGAEFSFSADSLVVFDANSALKVLNVDADVDFKDFPIYKQVLGKEDDYVEVRLNSKTSLDIKFDGQKFFSINADVLDFDFSHSIEGEPIFSCFDKNGNPIDADGILTTATKDKILSEIYFTNVYYSADIKTGNEIQKGSFTVARRNEKDGEAINTVSGNMIYNSAPDFPVPEAIIEQMKEALKSATAARNNQ